MNDMAAVNRRVEEILSQMTVEEKADLMCGDGMWFVRGVPRLGVPPMRVTDCGHGVTATGQERTLASCFPTAVGQAATWNVELVERLGAAMGREVLATGNGMLLGPMINLHRMPLNGRGYECYSEDPYLTGKMAAALVRGIQSQGAGACVKGCAANNQQAFQEQLNVIVDERTLREIYLPGFATVVAEGRPWAVMTCYNGLNGEHSSACRHLLTDIVKNEWGFDGFIVSDWRGTHSPAVLASGLDLEMPGPGKFMRRQDVLPALAEGRLSQADLDDHARRLLRAIVRAEATAADAKRRKGALDTPAHRRLAREVAEEAIVLLKNDRGLLPLNPKRLSAVAVTGPNAGPARLGGGGSASVAPFYSVGPLQGLRNLLGRDVRVIYQEGCAFLGDLGLVTPEYLSTPSDMPRERGLRAEFFNDTDLNGEPVHTTVQSHVDFSWGWASPGDRVRRNEWSARWTGQLTPPVTGRYRLGAACRDGRFRLYVNGQLQVDRWAAPKKDDPDFSPNVYHSASAELDLVAGQPVDVRLDFSRGSSKASLRLEWAVPGWADPVERAVAAARDADVAIVCAGISNTHEGGTNDKKDLELPGRQVELIQAVAAANPNTVVVLIGGTPLNVQPWIGQVAAVVEAWYGGQEGGNALARVLCGKVNPSGKLPDTFPSRVEDNPAWGNYPGDGKSVTYAEGVFVGYRHYDTRGIEPAFPFGFGLSYTRFEYANLRLSSATMSSDQAITVSVDVTNTGRRAGQEVVQLYVRDPEASVPRPVRELKGFAKVALKRGQTRTVTFTLTPRELAFFDVGRNAWRTEPGAFEIQVGPHSREGLVARMEYRE
jgi:beta-glucosidase